MAAAVTMTKSKDQEVEFLEEFATTAVVKRERVDGEQAVARDAES